MTNNFPFQREREQNQAKKEKRISERKAKQQVFDELAKLEKQYALLDKQAELASENTLSSGLEEQSFLQAYESSYGFLAHSWNIFERNDFMPSKILQAIGEHLDACLNGEIKRLIINVFPRAAKSALVNKAFPTYCWIKKPELRFANVSYAQSLAVEGSLHSKKIITSDWYKKGMNTIWKSMNGWDSVWELATNKNNEESSSNRNLQEDYYNTWNGRRFSTSIGGAFTGKGADFIIIDDPINPEMANSKIELENANRWFDQTAIQRLDDKLTGVIILIMQRLHMNDMSGKFIEEGGWEHLSIPMEFDETKRFFTKIGWTDWRKKTGDIADPVRFPEEVIHDLKSRNEVWQSQYQQDPVPAGGSKLKLEWLKTWYVMPREFDSICIACDFNTKKGTANDNTSLMIVGRRKNDFFVLDLVYGNMDIQDQLEAVTLLSQKWNQVQVKLIEDKSNGSPVWTLLHRHIPGLRPIVPPPIEKELRITSTLVPKMVTGNIFLPEVTAFPWAKNLITEIRNFPRGHDDALDTLQMSVEFLERSNQVCYMPAEIITESANTVSRSQIRDIFSENNRYNVQTRIDVSQIRELFS